MDTNHQSNNNDNIEQLTMTLRLMGFLNASHYAVFNGKKGQNHSHSWQLQFEVEIPVAGQGLVRFDDLEKLINGILQPYQRTVLNDMEPFQNFQPFTENIAAHFFNSLSDLLADKKARLTKLVVWENPTKGVEVTTRLPYDMLAGQRPNKNLVQPTAAMPPVFANQAETPKKLISSFKNSILNRKTNESHPKGSSAIAAANCNINTGESVVTDEGVPETQENSHDNTVKNIQEVIAQTAATDEMMGNDDCLEPDLALIQELLAIDPYAELSRQELTSDSSKLLRGKKKIAWAGKGIEETDDSMEDRQSRHSWLTWLIVIIFIATVAFIAYYPLLMAPNYQVYPWGSDTWGHLYKAKFLADQIAKGNFYPQFSADWYNGNQPFRYWAPLPYYVLAGLYYLTSNLFAAGNYYIVLCAIIGALGWLSWRQRLPLGICILMAVIWLIWPDNVRVALSEGNFPRILATALLPLMVSNYINSLERKRTWGSVMITVLLVHLAVLCHAMIGAVYCVALFTFTVFYWMFGGTSLKKSSCGIAALILGVLTSAWWLLPAMSGGILAMDSFGAGGVQYIPFLQAFDPRIYLADREVTYLGISMLLVLLLSFVSWRMLPRWSKALFLTGVILTIISFPSFSWLHRLMPFSGILWPLRFRSIAGLMLLASVATNGYFYIKKVPRQQIWSWLTVGVLLLVIIDSGLYADRLVFVKGLPLDVVNISKKLNDHTGWRIATLDVSSLGSPPAYLFAEESGREQVFGWAWQGATTAPNIMLLNTALDFKLYPYVVKQLYFLGATDVMTNAKIIKNPEAFAVLLGQYGFTSVVGKGSRISYWHGGDQPYLIVPQPEGLVIGKFASIYALQFPSLQIGNSRQIDDYKLEDLKRYPVVILTGAGWHSHKNAESLILAYAKQGGRVVVDLNSFPDDVFSKQPKFLGVYGQQISMRGGIKATSHDGAQSNWQPFDSSYLPWATFVPMPLDEEVWKFNYMNSSATLFGNKKIDGVKIGFIGANAVYHAFLTGDQTARQWLGSCLGLSQDFKLPVLIPIKNYHVEKDGYTLNYNLAKEEKVVIPIAKLDGMQAYVDTKKVVSESYENLTMIMLPAGQHSLRLRVEPTPVYYQGLRISFLACLIIILAQPKIRTKITACCKYCSKNRAKGETL